MLQKRYLLSILTAFVFAVTAVQVCAAPCPTSGYASVLLRGSMVENNLSLTPQWSGGDGATSTQTIGDMECKRADGNYIYFRVADSWMKDCNQTMYLEVAYYNNKSSSYYMQPQ